MRSKTWLAFLIVLSMTLWACDEVSLNVEPCRIQWDAKELLCAKADGSSTYRIPAAEENHIAMSVADSRKVFSHIQELERQLAQCKP